MERRDHTALIDGRHVRLIRQELPGSSRDRSSHAPLMGMPNGNCALRTEVSVYFLRPGTADLVSRPHRRDLDADRHLSRDRHPRRHGDLDLYRAQHAGDGTAGHHLWRVLDQLQRQRHQGHRVANAQRDLDSEDLLPARRQSRPRDCTNRSRHQLGARHHAGRHPGAHRRQVQCFERAGAADRPELRQPQRAAAL